MISGSYIAGSYEECNNGIGWSEPENAAQECGWPPGAKGHIKDCCCCYLTAHIHDLGEEINNADVEIEYRPGLYQGCTSLMNVYSSTDGEEWELFHESTVTQETWSPKTTYKELLTNVPDSFRYIKIEIPECYNDYSSAKVVY